MDKDVSIAMLALAKAILALDSKITNILSLLSANKDLLHKLSEAQTLAELERLDESYRQEINKFIKIIEDASK